MTEHEQTDMLTREQVIAELAQMGIEVHDRQLRAWVTYGLIPKPIVRLPPHATDGVARALFHRSQVIAIARVALQRGLVRDDVLDRLAQVLVDHTNQSNGRGDD